MTEPSMPVAQISDDTKIETNWGVISAYQKQINDRDSKIADLLVERSALTEAVRARDAIIAELERRVEEETGPGTPIARIGGIVEFVIERRLGTGFEAKPPEMILMDAFRARDALLAECVEKMRPIAAEAAKWKNIRNTAMRPICARPDPEENTDLDAASFTVGDLRAIASLVAKIEGS